MATNNAVNVGLAGSTGTGTFVGATSPTLITPLLGTPTSGTLTNCTGLPVSTGISGLGANVATWLATPSSGNLAAAVTGETGTGSLVFAISPSFVTPSLGAATATSINFGDTSLANYVEGTFTPVLSNGGVGSATYSTQTGTYTRIGNRVIFSISIIITNHTFLPGVLTITGLPITVGQQTSGGIYATNLAAGVAGVMIKLSSTIVELYSFAAGAATALSVANITTTANFIIGASYKI